MTTYNTGNPIGSTDARDRLDNSENMDILENSTTLDTHADRLGTMRKTRKGMELEHDNQISAHESEHDAQIAAHETEHDNQMQSFENDFDSRLAGMAFTRIGTFTAGATLTDMRQTLLWEVSQGGDGREYGWTGSFLPSGKVVVAGSTPATTGGIGAGNWVDRTEGRLRSDLNVVVKVFESVADMVADATLIVGRKCRTLGYYAAGDGGGNDYEIVSATTGTDDGGSYIDLSGSGFQAKGLFLDGVATPLRFGAKGDVTTDDRGAFFACLSMSNSTPISAGDYLIDGARLGEFQKPINVIGSGPDVIIRLPPTNTDKTAFRVGAVGSGFYRTRAITKFQNLVFTIQEGQLAPWAYTGIDLQSVFPVNLKDLVLLSMGPGGIKIKDCFYGYTEGVILVNSGLNLFEVNTINFTGFESRPEQNDIDPTGGGLLFGDVGEYPILMEDSDLVSFHGVIEGWRVPTLKLIRCDDTVFNNTWFEGLQSTSHVIKMEQSQDLEFNSCQLDFAFPYNDSFILVDNSIPDSDRRQTQTTMIRVNGGNLLLRSVGFGSRKEFVKTVNASDRVSVLIDGTSFRGGSLFGSKNVNFDVKSIRLTRESVKFFYSLPNAILNKEINSWIRDGSASSDWDFSGGANVSQIGGSGLTIAVTSADGEFMTGTRGVKVSGILPGATVWQFGRTASGQIPPVSSEGQTYLFFARIKSSEDVKVTIDINSGFLDYSDAKQFELEANKWIDVVLKTQEDTTWAQAKSFPPTFKFKVMNSSGSSADFFIDRLDYALVDGDIEI